MQIKIDTQHVAKVDIPGGVLASLQCGDGLELAKAKRMLIYTHSIKHAFTGMIETLDDIVETGIIDDEVIEEVLEDANSLYDKIWR